MRTATIAALTLMSLTALPAQAQSNGQPYRAAGTEPFWSVTIDSRTIRYQPMEGRAVTVAKPRPRTTFNGERYVTRNLTVDITHVRCSDGMSDRRYPDTVTVTVGRRTLKGCGGAAERPGQVAPRVDGDWIVRTIGGRAPLPRTNPSVRFSETAISGTTGCNSFRGSYRIDGNRMTAGPLASTKRGCTPQLNQQEQRLLGMLGQRLTATRTRDGLLVLTSRDGQMLVLARRR